MKITLERSISKILKEKHSLAKRNLKPQISARICNMDFTIKVRKSVKCYGLAIPIFQDEDKLIARYGLKTKSPNNRLSNNKAHFLILIGEKSLESYKELDDTIAHEIAHFACFTYQGLTPNKLHNSLWQNLAQNLGCYQIEYKD